MGRRETVGACSRNAPRTRTTRPGHRVRRHSCRTRTTAAAPAAPADARPAAAPAPGRSVRSSRSNGRVTALPGRRTGAGAGPGSTRAACRARGGR
ncbi:hypothetical protein C0036_23300 [Streptomyces sp. DJ]|nr:hypothetical protein C0036_23300 [Streptomyces sp. DJ]